MQTVDPGLCPDGDSVFEFAKIDLEWHTSMPAFFNLLSFPYTIVLVLRNARSAIVSGVLPLISASLRFGRLQRQLERGRSEATSATLHHNSIPTVQAEQHGAANDMHHLLGQIPRLFQRRDTAVPPTIDIELVKLLHEIRMDVLQTPGKKLHFQKSVARYCRAQVSAWEEQLASIGCI